MLAAPTRYPCRSQVERVERIFECIPPVAMTGEVRRVEDGRGRIREGSMEYEVATGSDGSVNFKSVRLSCRRIVIIIVFQA